MVEPFAKAFLQTKGSRILKIASGMKESARYMKISIEPSEWFVGNRGKWDGMSIRYHRSRGLEANPIVYLKRSFPKNFLAEAWYFMRLFSQDTSFVIDLPRKRKDKLRIKNKCLWGGGGYGGHSNPDYKLFLESGTDGLRGKIALYREKNKGKEEFYDALVLTLDGLDILAERYQQEAKKMLPDAREEDKKILRRLIKAFDTIPKKEPNDFFEACQMFWLAFGYLEIDSPGLFDYAFGKYYEKSDTLDRYLCLKKLWDLFYKTRTWNLCIGGSDENGQDRCNDLTYDILRVAREYRYNTPNLTMRFHKNSPQKAWEEATETLATGIGMPAIYNDECVCKSLEDIGIPQEHSHLYCMNGCNQIDIFGKSHMGLEDGEINMAKALEFVLYNGRCGKSRLLLGKRTGKIESLDTFDKFLGAYFAQVEYMADRICALSNDSQEKYARLYPNPWLSNLIEGCIEKGVDYKNGGPLYGHGQVLTEGLPDTADSLCAIKHFVYDIKKYSLSEVKKALKKDFVGYAELYHDFSTYHKFGNDIEEVDEIYRIISDHVYRYFLTKKTFRGGVFGVGCSTFSRSAEYGRKLGALPNGKKRRDTTLADSIGAVPGCDEIGPTALLNSVLKFDQTLAKSGNVMQIKFPSRQFATPTGKQAFISLAKTYFYRGGQTLQINVVSKEELLDAQINPDKHRNLIVRVGGFSQYFVLLDKGLQDNIIKRTENEL